MLVAVERVMSTISLSNANFNAVLHEHQQYVSSNRLTEAQHAAYEER